MVILICNMAIIYSIFNMAMLCYNGYGSKEICIFTVYCVQYMEWNRNILPVVIIVLV